jgi:Ubiquitin-protein ligase
MALKGWYHPLDFLSLYIHVCVLHFSIDLSVEEGGGTMELVSGGRDMEVTAQNVYDYVRKYAEYRMIKAQEKALEVSWIMCNSVC